MNCIGAGEMFDNYKSFSKRHNMKSREKEITVREDAPREFREALLQVSIAVELEPSHIREIVCRVLKKLPNKDNCSQYPNIWGEVQEYVLNCEWFFVYDITEGIYSYLSKRNPEKAQEFEETINESLREFGIGWQLSEGLIQTRGPEVFESSVHVAKEILEETGRTTASHEIHEALMALSRRPEADSTGAVQHAMASLECIARDICGEPKATLGEIIKRHPGIFPRPIDNVISKAWGFASEMARHLQEGRVSEREEAELMVGLAATCATYLIRKTKS